MQKINVSAPGKIMLFGEYAVLLGQPCLVAAVNKRMYVTIEKRKDSLFALHAPDMQVNGYKKNMLKIGKGEMPKETHFAEVAVRNFFEQYPFQKGITVTATSAFSNKFGFGSSSAIVVCVIFALAKLFGVVLSKKELFALSYKTVLDVQKRGSGFDVASAIYGGLLYYVAGGKIMRKLPIEDIPLLVAYSGKKADTGLLLELFEQKLKRHKEIIIHTCALIGKIVEAAKEAIVKKEWDVVGRLMTVNNAYLTVFDINNKKIDALIDFAYKNNSYGAKTSGAGGGDSIIILIAHAKKKKCIKEFEKNDMQIIDIAIDSEGVRVEK